MILKNNTIYQNLFPIYIFQIFFSWTSREWFSTSGFPPKLNHVIRWTTVGKRREKRWRETSRIAGRREKFLQRLPARHPLYFRETFQRFLEKFAFKINIVRRQSTQRFVKSSQEVSIYFGELFGKEKHNSFVKAWGNHFTSWIKLSFCVNYDKNVVFSDPICKNSKVVRQRNTALKIIFR